MKMNCKTNFFSLIVLLFLSVQVQASSLPHLYEVTLPVISQDKQVRRAAFEQAFIDVSMRISGTSAAPTQLNLKKSSALVRQYRYKAMSQQEIDLYMESSKSLIVPKYKLWVQFDDGKVKKILGDNGLPIWGNQRPKVLVWLAVKDGRNRYLLKKTDVSQIKDELDKEAKRRGLPLIWPKYDAQDKQAVPFIDVWAEFLEPIKKASQRYSANAIIIGRMNWAQGNWQVNWTLLIGDEMNTWQLSATDLSLLMSNGIGTATDHISSRYSVFADSEIEGDILLRVSNLNSVKKYAVAAHYLSSLEAVNNVYASEINQDQVDFNIELNGNEDDLKRIIALSKVLVPDTRIKATDTIQKTIPEATPTLLKNETTADKKIAPLTAPEKTMPVKVQKNILHYRLSS